MLNLKGDTYGDTGGSEAVKSDHSFTSDLSNALFFEPGEFRTSASSNLRITSGGCWCGGDAAPVVASQAIFVESRGSRNSKKVGGVYSQVRKVTALVLSGTEPSFK